MQIAVVTTRATAGRARLTVRRAARTDPGATAVVLDLDATYRPEGHEHVIGPHDLGADLRTLHLEAARLGDLGLRRQWEPRLVRHLTARPDDRRSKGPVALLTPGLVLVRALAPWVEPTRPGAARVVTRSAVTVPGRRPDAEDAARLGAHCPALIALRSPLAALLDLWEASTARGDDRWLDVAVAARLVDADRDRTTVLGGWTLHPDDIVSVPDGVPGLTSNRGSTEDATRPLAVDLVDLDPARPWVLEPTAPGDPRGRLSEHPALASWVADVAAELAALASVAVDRLDEPVGGLDRTSLGTPVDAALTSLYSAAHDLPGTPDPFVPDEAEDFRRWLADGLEPGAPARYLAALRATRPDLQLAFPRVPGPDTEAYLGWVRRHAVDDGSPAPLVAAALVSHGGAGPVRSGTHHGRRPPGVNVIGYLRGELGIGESARLMVSALEAARIPHGPVAVDRHLTSRQGADASSTGSGSRSPTFDTSLICVNSDLTPSVAGSVTEVLEGGYRIGMWYWEVEDFPRSQHGGFAHVDEVWVATDFIRRAIEPHSPVPVRTVTPPLPQRGPDPTLSRSNLGLPDRPIFLFSFDFLSTAERKNPWGLVDAFTEAFTPGEGPVLVIKSINADQRPSEAERLRLRAASAPDVVLMEQYLDAAERDALVALCDCYVSLHRSEGLGLTMAEAMAWGKPVIATGYSGNLQFMTEQNSYLVPWSPAEIPAGAEPYPAGGTWAEPDLHAAAQLMRSVLEDPAEAAARGARAASDIATRHSAEVAGRVVATRLEEAAPRRRARARSARAARLRSTVRRLLG